MSAKVTVAAAPSAGDGVGHLKSRIGLDLESQADAAALERLYDSMARETETLGLDSDAIRSLWSFYRSCSIGEEEDEEEEGKPAARRRRRTTKPVAKHYSEFSPPLAPAAIRLLLFFLDGKECGGNPGVSLLRAAGDAAVKAVLAELDALDDGEVEKEREIETDNNPFPSFASAFHATPGRHMTVFQASHPASIVPDSTATEEKEEEEEENRSINDDGAGASTSNSEEEEQVQQEDERQRDDGLLGAPPPGALAREIAAARATALAVGSPPRLVAHRVFLARSGALLLTLTEEAAPGGSGGGDGRRSDGRVAALRREASSRMPRASKRQPAIMHVTLGRLLSPLPTAEAAARVSRAAEEAARPFLSRARESKQAWVPSVLAHVVENTFASVDGESVLLPFCSSS